MKLDQAKFFDTCPVLYPWPAILKQEGFGRLYKPRDVKFKQNLDLLGMKKGERVLDVGCGEGVFLERVVKNYHVLGTGIDISPLSIKRAKVNSRQQIKFLVADSTKLPFSRHAFDFVLNFDVLEHIGDPASAKATAGKQKKALLEMVRVLKPSGKLLIYALNKKQKFTWNWWLDKLGIDVYRAWAHDPNLFLSPEKTKRQLEKAGLVVKKLELFNSFFTLACDEAIMILVSLFSRLGLFRRRTKMNIVFGKTFLVLTDFFSRASLPILEFLDKPWIKKGYSNSFFLIAQKQ